MIPLADPSDSAFYTIGFDGIGTATISTATLTLPNTSPAELVQVGGAVIDNTASPKTVTVRISGAKHGMTYQCDIAATLDSGEVISRQFPLVGFNG